MSVLAGIPAVSFSAAAPVAYADAGSGSSEESPSEAEEAAEKAVETGERVEIVGERTEYATTYANPDGETFSLSMSTVPVRVRQDDGSWTEPDATLERRADGTIGPKAAVTNLSFSGGGGGDELVTVAEGEQSLTVGWLGELPEPTLDGASAVYADVLPGVDLRLTATTEGYREVLVVKSAEAAASDELKKLDFPVEAQGLTLRGGVGGGLDAVDENGNAVFRTPTARQWDSAGDAASSETSTMSLVSSDADTATDDSSTHDGEFTPDPAEGPSDGDAFAVLPVTADDDSITVIPDADLLTGVDTVYPLYIDPDVSWGESERTVLSSDGDTFYNFSGGDDGEGVGYCGTYVTGGYAYYCGSGYKQRMYFEFSPSQLRGKRVLDATFRVTERWSMSCEKTTIDLIRTPNISSSTKWPGPTSNWDKMGDRTVSAGRGTLCDPSQPDAPIEFNDDPSQSYENLTNTVKAFAAGSFSRLTLMLKAHDESDPNGWKRFDDDAVLDVDFVGVPATPTSPGVRSGEISSCETDASDPDVLSDPTPTLTAVAQTQPGGEDEARLRVHFYVQKKNEDNTWSTVTEPVRPSWPDSVGDGQTVEVSSPVTLSEGTSYRMGVFTRSYYNSGTSFLESPSTAASKGYCYFLVDTTRPKAPVITLGEPYSVCTANACAAAGGPGVKGGFTFAPAAGDESTVVAYRYKLSSSSTWSSTISGNTVTRQIAPELSGTQVLQVRALDNVGSGRWGAIAGVRFNVKESEGATGRWHFDDSVPGTGGTTAADTATAEGTRHPATLYTEGAGWSSLARRGTDDRSLWLNDTTDANRQSGYAMTSGPVVNTQSSFTVSAWAYLTEKSAYRTVVSQTGSDRSGFSLYYSPGVDKWVFLWSWSDGGTRRYVGANADMAGVPLKVWTQVAGVYNAENKTIQLFVNGRAQGSPVALPSGAATQTPDGKMQFGRAEYTAGSPQDYWRGRVDEVAVFQQALQPGDVAKEARLLDAADTATATELVGAWNPDGASGTTLADTVSGYGRTLTLSGGASLDGEVIVLDGTDDAATVSGPVVDESGSFTVTTEVELDQAVLNTKSTGFTAQVLGQRSADGSAWGFWYEQTGTETRFDDEDNPYEVPVGFWRFGRLAGNGTFTAVDSDSAAVVGSRVRLTGVYDAQASTIALYLDSTQNDTDTPYTAVIGSGELAVGKGYVGSSWGHYLPGRISDIRIWAGAAADGTQVDTMTSG